MKRDSVITLVELAPTAFGKLNGDLVEDAYCKCRFPARATPLLHAILLREGFTDIVSINPASDGRAGRLGPDDIERVCASDFLLLSTITRTIQQTEELARLYRERNRAGKIIIGGPHATYMPEECLGWADVVVRQEGDKTLPELLDAFLEQGTPAGVKGVSYKNDGRIVHEEAREPLTEEELSDLPAPYYDSPTLARMRVLPICTSRGCPFTCDFCSVWKLYGRRYRRRSNESILKELEAAAHAPTRYLFFIDDNFCGRPEDTKKLLRMMIGRGLNKKPFLCQLSIYAAFDDELLDLLRRAGSFSVFLGIESINEETLRALNKKVNVQKNKEAVKRLRAAGFWVNGMMMIGGDGDTEEGLRETVRWVGESLDSVQYFTPTPLPGTKLAEDMEAAGRVLAGEYYLYDGQHVLIRPKHFTPLKLQEIIFRMYREFYSLGRIARSLLHTHYRLKKFAIYILAKNTVRGGFNNPQTRSYFKRLNELGRLAGEGAMSPILSKK